MTELTITTDRPADHLLIDLKTRHIWQATAVAPGRWVSLGELPPGIVDALKSGVAERTMTGGR